MGIVNMLADLDTLKSSMWHEYEGIIDDFAHRIDCWNVYCNDKASDEDTATINDTGIDFV